MDEKKRYIFEEIKKDLEKKKYELNKIEDIININQSNINNDIKSIENETQLDYKKATQLYIEHNYNSINSIFKYLNLNEKKKTEPIKEYNLVQEKINELRIIANDRDAYYENNKK
jgi:hypothetical protein